MNGVSAQAGRRGLPATNVLQLSPARPVRPRDRVCDGRAGGDTVLAAVSYPPRGGEPQSLAALVPAVLARYGLGAPEVTGEAVDCGA